jgi:hypothetical protein
LWVCRSDRRTASAGEEVHRSESTQLGVFTSPTTPRARLVLRALVPADRAAQAIATIDNCSNALKSVRTDPTDRDELRSCAPGNRLRIAATVATTSGKSRPVSFPNSGHDLSSRPSLTIAEAARLCGVSVSTIRCYLTAGRFPTAYQQPSPTPFQRGFWRIRPRTCSQPASGQARPAHQARNRTTSPGVAERPASLVMSGFQNLTCLGARADPPPRTWPPSEPTIQTLERALRALQAHHTAPTPNSERAAPSLAPPSDATSSRPAPRPGMLPMVPKRRRAKRELSQEEKAAIIGRALSRQRPPKRRWPSQPSRSSPPALPLAPPPTAAGSGRPIGPDDPLRSTAGGDSSPHGSSPSPTRHRYPD